MRTVIDVENINKSFYGKKVVNNISLKVEKGDIYGFWVQMALGKRQLFV